MTEISLVPKREMLKRVGLSYQTVYERIRRGTFPKGLVSGGKVFWRSDELAEWIEGLQRQTLKPVEADGEDQAPLSRAE